MSVNPAISFPWHRMPKVHAGMYTKTEEIPAELKGWVGRRVTVRWEPKLTKLPDGAYLHELEAVWEWLEHSSPSEAWDTASVDMRNMGESLE